MQLTAIPIPVSFTREPYLKSYFASALNYTDDKIVRTTIPDLCNLLRVRGLMIPITLTVMFHKDWAHRFPDVVPLVSAHPYEPSKPVGGYGQPPAATTTTPPTSGGRGAPGPTDVRRTRHRQRARTMEALLDMVDLSSPNPPDIPPDCIRRRRRIRQLSPRRPPPLMDCPPAAIPRHMALPHMGIPPRRRHRPRHDLVVIGDARFHDHTVPIRAVGVRRRHAGAVRIS